MPKAELLPGVRATRSRPRVICDSKTEITRARRIAAARDVAQVLLLAGVDYLFLRYPSTRIPMLDRITSLEVLAAFNAMIVAFIVLARTLPQWWARRIASTWCDSERARFFTPPRR